MTFIRSASRPATMLRTAWPAIRYGLTGPVAMPGNANFSREGVVMIYTDRNGRSRLRPKPGDRRW